MEYLARGLHAAKFPLLSVGQLGLVVVKFLPGAGIWDESCQQVEFRHDQRVSFAHGGEVPHYGMTGLNLLVAIVIHWNPSISAKRSDSGKPRD